MRSNCFIQASRAWCFDNRKRKKWLGNLIAAERRRWARQAFGCNVGLKLTFRLRPIIVGVAGEGCSFGNLVCSSPDLVV
jgi:hypothetical protein